MSTHMCSPPSEDPLLKSQQLSPQTHTHTYYLEMHVTTHNPIRSLPFVFSIVSYARYTIYRAGIKTSHLIFLPKVPVEDIKGEPDTVVPLLLECSVTASCFFLHGILVDGLSY